jgi:hypothetical protein
VDYLRHWPEQQPELCFCLADTTASATGDVDGVGYPVPLRDGKTWLRTLEDRFKAATGLPLDDLQYEYFGAGCNDIIMVCQTDEVLSEVSRKLDRDRDDQPFLRTVYMIGKDIHFGAHTDAYEVEVDSRARRRSVRIDPSRSARLREGAVLDFPPEIRPWDVTGSLREAVEYTLTEEYWECIEAGLKPLWHKPKGAITLM